ncbi:MAG: hypothetical protein SGI90_05470 [Candidatus Eisenbacteria bacterium]|nr:hypothetical protein [Candidatus Eisenbacteria bacterium]
MTQLVEICIVVLTVTVVLLTIVGIITMRHFSRILENTDRSLNRFETLLDETAKTVSEGRNVLVSVGAAVERLDEMTGEVRKVTHRIAQLSGSVLDGVEIPARGAIAIVRRVKSVANVLMSLWPRPKHADKNGNQAYESTISTGRIFS